MTDYPKTRLSSVQMADEATTKILALVTASPEVAAKIGHVVQGLARDCCCLVVTAVDEAERQRGAGPVPVAVEGA
jgi:hypothetical protein